MNIFITFIIEFIIIIFIGIIILFIWFFLDIVVLWLDEDERQDYEKKEYVKPTIERKAIYHPNHSHISHGNKHGPSLEIYDHICRKR